MSLIAPADRRADDGANWPPGDRYAPFMRGFSPPLTETVCCAGVTIDGQWRRQYPIHFRRLRDKFSRWQWIEYDWIAPGAEDRRKESRRVQEDTIQLGETMPERERAAFLDPIMTASTAEAAPIRCEFFMKSPTAVDSRSTCNGLNLNGHQLAPRIKQTPFLGIAFRVKSSVGWVIPAYSYIVQNYHFEWRMKYGGTMTTSGEVKGIAVPAVRIRRGLLPSFHPRLKVDRKNTPSVLVLNRTEYLNRYTAKCARSPNMPALMEA